jgi:hypothetical protein
MRGTLLADRFVIVVHDTGVYAGMNAGVETQV